MSSPSTPSPAPNAGPMPLGLPAWAWSLLALLLGLAGSFAMADQEFRRQQGERSAELATISERGYASIAERLRGCELLVRSVQTVFLSSDAVDPDEFQHVFANLRPHEIFPSLQALAFARRMPRPDGDHYVTEMVAPLAGNRDIIGLDINTQPTNFRGAQRSRDDNQPALSAPFRLRQQTAAEPAPDGVTLRLPVYGKGEPPATLAERRARTIGTLGASFRLSRLIPSAVPQEARERLHIRVDDVTDGTAQPLYDSLPGTQRSGLRHHTFERTLGYGGRSWRVRMHPLDGTAQSDWPWTIFAIGVLSSVLLAMLAWSIATTRRQALMLGERMSRSYRDSEERFRALNELLPALVLLARRDDGGILYANQAARDRLGADVEQVDLVDVFEDPALRLRLGSGETGALSNTEALLRSVNGDRFWASVSISEVSVGGQAKLLMVASDISEQRQLTELLSYQASHDALTELFNRREFERQVEHALSTLAAGGPPAALLYIDLDQFKLINDTSGHIAGDQLLTQLAEVMREQLRGADVLARLGGDEFGVLAPGSHREGAMLLAERLRARIDAFEFVWEQRNYAISASIGVVMVEDPDSTLKDVFALADTACYMAKESGRNRVHLFSAHDDATSRRRGEMEWANRLRGVVEEGRLLLYYQELQPLDASVKPGHIELLLRLREESGELVMPGAFLPAAERFGLMPLIDRWVIETALANFNRLHATGPELALCAINLSGASIDDESFAERIVGWLHDWQVEPSRVCFEVTETFAVRNMATTVRFIERLRDAGCRIALDDFGAGMSSFGYLKNLPIDMIKIDGSFIRDMASDPMSLAIVRAIADIGHQRGLEVIAEWVPDQDTVAALREIGVDYAQGFSLHHPEPALFQRR